MQTSIEPDQAVRSTAEMQRLVESRLPTINQLFATTHQAGFSLGVLHHGEVILKHNSGAQNISTGQCPTSDTLYCIGGLSQGFVAAAIDLLVQRGQLEWDTPVASILPQYARSDGDVMLGGMTLRDICSHRTGLSGLNSIIQGMDGRILFPKSDVIDIVNALPKKSQFRCSFEYNNAVFELAGCVIERVSKCTTWGDFLECNIFEPLDMSRTTTTRSVHRTDSNVAKGYTALPSLTNVSLHGIPPTELSEHSMNGASGGIRSSVNDLLKWCSCLLESFHGKKSPDNSPIRPHSPLFDRATMVNPASTQDGDYCSGWCYHQIPSKLGLTSANRDYPRPILGAQSKSFVIYGQQGDVPGYTSSLYLIPHTRSAVVILSNGTGRSDATDWAAQDLIQAMYSLQPIIDYTEVARRSAQWFIKWFQGGFLIPLLENQTLGTPMPSPDEFVGEYKMKGLPAATLTLLTDYPNCLTMRINEQQDQQYALYHHHYDTWRYVPLRYCEYLKRALYRGSWESFLIAFKRDSEGHVCGLTWNGDGMPVIFDKLGDRI